MTRMRELQDDLGRYNSFEEYNTDVFRMPVNLELKIKYYNEGEIGTPIYLMAYSSFHIIIPFQAK